MNRKPHVVALVTSLGYGIVAGLWMLFSDRMLAEFVRDQERLMRLETYKGWAFVAFTGLMFFLILRQLLASEQQKIRQLQKAEALANLQRETLERIARGKSLPETLDQLLRAIEAMSPDLLGSVLLLDKDGIHLRHGAAPSLPDAYNRAIDGVAIGPKVGSCGTAAFRGSPVFASDIARDPLWADYKHLALEHGLRSCWSTPILDEQKKVLGTFAIYHRAPGLPEAEDVRIIELVTHSVATGIIKQRAEQALRESEERFRTLIENASDAVFVHDVNGWFQHVNQSACAELGYTREELLRMTVADIEADLPFAQVQAIWQQMQPGQAQIVRGRQRRKDGTSFPMEVNVTCYEIQGQKVLLALSRNISKRQEYEEQLAQSISLLRATIESSVSGLLVVDTQGKAAIYNNRFLEMWRIPAEIAAQGDDQCMLKLALEQVQSPDEFLHRVAELYQHPGKEAYDLITFKDGRVFDRVSRPQRLGEKIIGRVWSFRDVTAQHKAEKRLAASEESYRNFFNTIGDAIYVLDEAGKFLAVNDGAVKMYGHAKEDFIGQTPAFLSAPGLNDISVAVAAIQKAFAGEPQQFEWWGLRKNGEVFPKEVRLQNGSYFGQKVVFASGRDITQRRQAEAALEHERRLLRTMVDLAPDFIFVKDTDSRYLVVNDALAKCYRRQPAEMLGHTDADFVSAELAARFRQSEQEVIATGTLRSYEDTIAFPDGRTRTVVTNMVAFHDNQGNIGGLVGIGRDITAQKETEKSMRLQSASLHAAANAILITDRHGAIEWTNPAFSQSSGYSLEECLGKNPRDLVRSGKHGKEFYQHMWETILAGEVWRGEITNRRKDGSFYLEEMTITPLQDGQKKITHFIAIKQDITRRRQMEEELRRAADRTQFYMNRMPLAFIAWDRNFCVAEWNAAAERIFGWPASEAIGRHAFELIVPSSVQPQVSKVWEEIIQTGNLMSHSINENLTRDGRTIICDWRNTPWRDGNGQICGCLSLVGDITEQKQAEEKFAREQTRFKLIFDAMPIGIAFHTVHPDGSFTRTINDAHLQICGLTREQHSQQDIYARLTHPDDFVLQQQFNEKVNAGRINQFAMEKRYIRPDGKTVWVNFSYQREIYPDGTKEELTTIVDITERKRLEEQLRQSQKMEAIGQLSGGIAHDFNNILTVIQGNAALLQGLDLEPSEVRDCSNQIARAGERAAGLTRQLLMFARRQQMQPVHLDLNETALHMTKMLQRILGEDIILRAEYSPALPLIQADVGMMEQIILNLAVNARDAMPGGGTLTICTKVENPPVVETPPNPDSQYVCLAITDTGTGIPPEILPRIFEPFFTTKEVGKGTGLGLATVYGIIQQHHGEITVQSESGRGTTFKVFFPITTSPSSSTTEITRRHTLAPGKETILLVEDELPLRSFVSELLQRCGYTVLEAEAGPAALEIWKQHREKIQLLLTDVIMPENINGIELGRRLLADKPSLKVIHMSGYTGNLEGRQATLVEGVNFIRKPFKPEAITEIIRKHLDGKIGRK